MAGLAFNAQLLVAKVVSAGRVGAAEGRGCGDPVGCRQRRPRDQPEPRRCARPAQLQPRHLLAARAGRHRLRVRQGCGGRRRGRERARSRRSTPWSYADYPAALPHVVGVSAIRQDGSVPSYSNRDAIFVDVAAPGDNIFSTIPQSLTTAGCTDGPYSDCGPDRVPRRDRHVVRGAAGLRRGRAHPRPGPDAHARPGLVAARAERRRRERRERLHRMPAGPRRLHRLGTARHPGGADRPDHRHAPAAARPVRAERRRRLVRARAAAAAAHDLGDARLLGRPDRRLPGRPEEGAAPVRPPHTAGGRRDQARPLARPAPSASRASTSI